MTDSVDVDPLVAKTIARVSYDHDTHQFGIPMASMLELAKEFSSGKTGLGQAKQLLAFVLKYEDTDAERTLPARAQLLVLMGLALKNAETFSAILRDGNVVLDKKMGAAIGAESSKIPVGHQKKIGVSLVDARNYEDE